MLGCLIAVICVFILSPSFPIVFSRSRGCINQETITTNLATITTNLHLYIFITLLHTQFKKKNM